MVTTLFLLQQTMEEIFSVFHFSNTNDNFEAKYFNRFIFFCTPTYILIACRFMQLRFFVPAERVRAGDYEIAPYVCVSVCTCASVQMFNLLLLCHLWTDFDSVCFIWKHYMGASKLLQWFTPVTFDLYCTFCYKMLLLPHFWPNFDSVCFIW